MMIDTTLRTFRPESRLSYELQELVQYSEMRSVNLVKFYVVEQEWESLVKFETCLLIRLRSTVGVHFQNSSFMNI